MDQHRHDDAHKLTPRIYQCKACGAVLRMRIEPPFWFCCNCDAKLIPADLLPRDESNEQVPDNGQSG